MKKTLSLILAAGVCLIAAISNAAAQAAAPPRDRTTPVKIGEMAPDFTLSDTNGKSFTLSKLKNPVVLVFYRGYW